MKRRPLVSQPGRLAVWRDVVESLPDAIIVVSPALEPITLNPAAEAMLGVSQASAFPLNELLGRNPWLEQMLRGCLESGHDLNRTEAELQLTLRSLRVRTEVCSLLDSRGKLQGAIILLHDLSYEKGIGQRFAGDESALGLSPAGLAHEIRNPLTGIKGAVELLAAMIPSDPRAQQYCTLIAQGADRLSALVEQVLSVSAPQRLKNESVNVHQVLHHSLALAGLHPTPGANIKIDQQFDPSLPEVSGDRAALERVFLNLVKNATEAIGSRGTIRLKTRMETEFRMASGGRRRQFLRVEVIDSGPGLSDAELGQLFTPFFTTKADGTGLGLVLSQRIIALHGGRLWVERSEDPQLAGLSFKVSLPIRPSASSDS